MKNALLLLSIWVGIIIAAYGLVYWDRGIEQPLPISILESSDSTYADPGGRFSLVYPSAWALEVTEASVFLTDPRGSVEISIFAAEEPVPESALLHAMGLIDAEAEHGSLAVEAIPAGASERAVRIAGPTDAGDVRYGLAYLYEGESIVVLVRGDESAIEARRASLDRIESAIAVPAAQVPEDVPLGDVEPVVQL